MPRTLFSTIFCCFVVLSFWGLKTSYGRALTTEQSPELPISIENSTPVLQLQPQQNFDESQQTTTASDETTNLNATATAIVTSDALENVQEQTRTASSLEQQTEIPKTTTSNSVTIDYGNVAKQGPAHEMSKTTSSQVVSSEAYASMLTTEPESNRQNFGDTSTQIQFTEQTSESSSTSMPLEQLYSTTGFPRRVPEQQNIGEEGSNLTTTELESTTIETAQETTTSLAATTDTQEDITASSSAVDISSGNLDKDTTLTNFTNTVAGPVEIPSKVQTETETGSTLSVASQSPTSTEDEQEPPMQKALEQDILATTPQVVATTESTKAAEVEDTPRVAMSDYDFTQPDAVVEHVVTEGSTYLEAYRRRTNDVILAHNDSLAFSQLSWVSVGHVTPLKVRRGENGSAISELFYCTDEGFHFYLGSLSNEHRELFIKEITRKYHVTPTRQQIIQLRADTLGCTIRFRHNGTKYALDGDVYQMATVPWKVEFMIEEGNRGRWAMEQVVHSGRKLTIDCEITKYVRLARRNFLQIMPEEVASLRLAERLLGGAKEKYVTRQQIVELAHELAAHLDVFKEFDIATPERFRTNFVQPLIDQLVTTSFHQQPIERALLDLSPFNFDHGLNGDFNVEQIKQVLSKIFSLIRTDDREHIIADSTYHGTLVQKAKESSAGSAKTGGILAQLANVEAAIDFVIEKEREFERCAKSAERQLSEINENSGSDILWKIEGTDIRPAGVLVTKISQSSFEKTLEFPRVYRKLTSADFHKQFRLYTNHAPEFETSLRDHVSTLHDNFMAISVRMATAEMSLNSLKKTLEEDMQRRTELIQDVTLLKEQLKLLNASRHEMAEELVFIKENFATNDALDRLYRSLNRRVPN